MNYKIKSLKTFHKQVSKLNKNSKRVIYDKIQLLKKNPYRFKRIHSKQYSKVFRIRLNIKSKETRMIYTIIEPNVILVCLLDRKKDYKDLEKYLSKIPKN